MFAAHPAQFPFFASKKWRNADGKWKLQSSLRHRPVFGSRPMVAQRQGGPFGRLAARAEDGRIRLWNPDFDAATPPDDMQAAMRLLIGRVAAIRQEAGLAHLAIENRPGDDLPHNDLWLRALGREGYAETCVYRVYVSSLDRAQSPGCKPAGLSIQEMDAACEESLLALYRRVKSQTFEQRDVGYKRPEDAIEAKKQIGRGRDGACWLLACLDGTPAGYALANLADEPDCEGLSAWLVDIGCVPEQRRKGIAAALLGEIMRRLRSAGARRLLAAIDDVNVPSIRLHGSLGFQALADRHYVYRLAA